MKCYRCWGGNGGLYSSYAPVISVESTEESGTRFRRIGLNLREHMGGTSLKLTCEHERHWSQASLQ